MPENSLHWLKEAGVEWIAAETPHNYLDSKADKKSVAAKAAPQHAVVQAMATKTQGITKETALGMTTVERQKQVNSQAQNSSLNEAIAAARMLADSARNLVELRLSVEEFTSCDLKKTANKTVFADGNPETRLLLIGEAPGADEDIQGIPFCGMSGQVLDKVLNSVGLDRNTGFYITNTVFWRPPGNRKPTPEEIAICLPFLEKHIALVNPKMLVLVGATAVQAILQDNSAMTKMRGQFYEYKNKYMSHAAKVMVTYHPSYLMRAGLNKRLAWEDMLTLQDFLTAH